MLRSWLGGAIADKDRTASLLEDLATLERVASQDIEPDPDDGGPRIRRGTSKDRRISISDPDMRHGRKSKSRVINGYKRHVAIDMDSGIILATAVCPANQHDHVAMGEELRARLDEHGGVEELHIDRGYLSGAWVKDLYAAGRTVVSKAWTYPNRHGRFSKTTFRIDVDGATATCPNGKTARIGGDNARFSSKDCRPCPLRDQCTTAASRSIQIHELEPMLQQLLAEQRTTAGREARRERVAVEHCLAHTTRRQGRRARYRGIRKSLFDLRRTAAVENPHTIERRRAA